MKQSLHPTVETKKNPQTPLQLGCGHMAKLNSKIYLHLESENCDMRRVPKAHLVGDCGSTGSSRDSMQNQPQCCWQCKSQGFSGVLTM